MTLAYQQMHQAAVTWHRPRADNSQIKFKMHMHWQNTCLKLRLQYIICFNLYLNESNLKINSALWQNKIICTYCHWFKFKILALPSVKYFITTIRFIYVSNGLEKKMLIGCLQQSDWGGNRSLTFITLQVWSHRYCILKQFMGLLLTVRRYMGKYILGLSKPV